MRESLLVPIAGALLSPVVSARTVLEKLNERHLEREMVDPVVDMWSMSYQFNNSLQKVHLQLIENPYGLAIPIVDNDMEEGLTTWFAYAMRVADGSCSMDIEEIKQRSKNVIQGLSEGIFRVLSWQI